jgi:hypothetical protein
VNAGRHRRSTRALASRSVELAAAVPQVVAHRLGRMAQAGPNPSARDRKEFARMVLEKQSAFVESWGAMAWQTLLAQQAFAASLVRSVSPLGRPRAASAGTALALEWQRAALAVLGKGLAPVHRRAVANAKRLGRTTRR